MKQTTLFLSIMLGLVFGCNDNATESTLIDVPEVRIEANGVTFTLTLLGNTFQLTDTLQGTFRVSNESGTARRFDFANIQQLGFRLSDSNGNVALFQPYIVSPALSRLDFLMVNQKNTQSPQS